MNNYSFYNHYNALMQLCQDASSTFYYVDQMIDNVTYRIFSYRLATYTEFCAPYAKECRGHTFEIDGNNHAVRIASFTPTKFFNLGELEGHINTIEAKLERAKIAYEQNKLSEELYFKLVRDNAK